MLQVSVDYRQEKVEGILSVPDAASESSIWDRIRQSSSLKEDCVFSQSEIRLPWTSILEVLREFTPQQKRLGFSFKATQAARPRIDEFVAQYKAVIRAQAEKPAVISEQEISDKLTSIGFTKRILKPFQMRDLQVLLSLRNGANFSVPGAGKTTVTFALSILASKPTDTLIVVCPKSAFPAWSSVVEECIDCQAPSWAKEAFTILSGGPASVSSSLFSCARRFVINYEQLISCGQILSQYLLNHRVHLVLDESHRMKGGLSVKRGAVLLNMASLPFRRDILSGTPMPQSPDDLKSQLDFLWPGSDLGFRASQATSPRKVISNLYVRTTKTDLGLPPISRKFHHVQMGPAQTALYAVVRNEALRSLSSLRSGSGIDVPKARRSVMRLLQLSANPVVALRGMTDDVSTIQSGLIQQVIEEGPSQKMLYARDMIRELAHSGRKVVLWTIFTDTIKQMEVLLAEFGAVSIYGETPSGVATNPETREGKLFAFHNDPGCMVLIANPAAAGEGISLHQVCHEAIYLDRSYNATHYLQSIDRIHRLGLAMDIETNVHILQTLAPKSLGCIDHSVSRRLAVKLRALERLLDDSDIHRIALDEEEANEPVDYDINPEDLADIIEELEGKTSYSEDEFV